MAETFEKIMNKADTNEEDFWKEAEKLTVKERLNLLPEKTRKAVETLKGAKKLNRIFPKDTRVLENYIPHVYSVSGEMVR